MATASDGRVGAEPTLAIVTVVDHVSEPTSGAS